MSTELTYLAFTIALFFVVVMVQANAGVQAQGGKAMLGARDNLAPPSALQSRTKRVVDNFRENLWFFAPLVLIAAISDISNQWTVLGVQLFFWGRVGHSISYIAGWVIRPLFWFVGIVGCVMIFLALFGIIR